jgi:hypothetical protein
VPLQSFAGPRCGLPRVAARQSHSLDVRLRFVRAPRPVAVRWFPAPPPRFRPPWGLPGTAPSAARRLRRRRSCAWPVLGVSDFAIPLPARRWGDGSPGVSSPAAHASTEDPVAPGGSCPRHLPPSGFGYPPGGLLPSVPDGGPSAAAAPMGFALQGLAPPGQRYPSRGLASPVVSSDRPDGRPAATPEVDSGREGARRAAEAATEPCPPGFRPSKALSSDAFAPASRY